MPKKKKPAEPAVPRIPDDEISGHKIKVLVGVDGQWYEVDGATYLSRSHWSYMINEGAVTRTIRDVGPIPVPKRWRNA